MHERLSACAASPPQVDQSLRRDSNAGFVCRRCGISRPTLRKWWRRFQECGEQGLLSNNRRPHSSPNSKVTTQHEELILRLRRERKLGPLRIQAELLRLHNLRFSTATIWKVLDRHQARPLQRRRTPSPKRYSRKVPGECVQVDTRKIAPGVYQYTAVDDCTRLRVLGIYPRRTCLFRYLLKLSKKAICATPNCHFHRLQSISSLNASARGR